jgi:hypothetical protein
VASTTPRPCWSNQMVGDRPGCQWVRRQVKRMTNAGTISTRPLQMSVPTSRSARENATKVVALGDNPSTFDMNHECNFCFRQKKVCPKMERFRFLIVYQDLLGHT